MKKSSLYILPVLLSLCVCSHGSNSVVNMSHYDEMNPHFSKMANEGIVGTIHEATYPISKIDDKYGRRQMDALSAGLLWGAYHFGDATDPVRQADHFLDLVASKWQVPGSSSKKNGGVLLVLDFEENNHYPGGTMRVDQAVKFVEYVRRRTGKYPGLYASENRIKEIINNPRVDPSAKSSLSRCWLWVANYHYQPRATAPWGNWSLWQYTGDGICDLPRALFPIGVANIRKAERNMFSGSTGAARAFWRDHAWLPEG
ncbi:glycoside hydrolase family 25 protein [Verrucomicrobiota bacterium sgz303538]